MAAAKTRDPVCGMGVDASVAKFRVQRGSATTNFCSERCKSKYLADPDKYAITSVTELPASAPTTKGVVYTCPMHPQIRRNAPGNCTICGMTLESVTATLEGGPSAELRDMTRRF